MGLQDLFMWRSQAAAATMPDIADEDVVADLDDPPDHRLAQLHPEFQKSAVRTQSDRKASLLTMALKTTEHPTSKPDLHIIPDLARRRSMMSNASIASTAELTSDGLTSPSRTNTPSPPPPSGVFTSFAPFSISKKFNRLPLPAMHSDIPTTNPRNKDPDIADGLSLSPKSEPVAPAVLKKRRITFACGGRKDPVAKPAALPVSPPVTPDMPSNEAPKRARTIKFACNAPRRSDRSSSGERACSPSQPLDLPKKPTSRSPSRTRKSPHPSVLQSRAHREATASFRRSSQSPVNTRSRPRYVGPEEKPLPSTEATRFHEFASENLEEDDWIRTGSDNPGKRLTINDTLKLENDIRRLGHEAEAEALEDEQDDEDNENGNDYDDGNDNDDDDDDDEDDDDSEDDDVSDGNETDNEAGFAESDESDQDAEFAFWTPGKDVVTGQPGEATTYRPSAHRSASISSIDSLIRSTSTKAESGKQRRGRRSRSIKVRPGTPDLPDSTDFVCGTLDEDRPLEEAYVSCMEARRNAKHRQTPQDIDPSFPTSDVEDEDDDDDHIPVIHESDDHVWIHGKFEDSGDERHGRRRSTSQRKSPGQSPKRLRSPPPPRRLRSPPPRKLFGHSPQRIRSPPPARTVKSPPASLMAHAAVGFAPLGSRPGLTHTKSLPRTPVAFARRYHASKLIAANGNYNDGTTDGHVRGAIDIVRGLEQKRQRRKDKFFAKNFNRKAKAQTDRRPQPGIGAERMRELGLLMAGKTGVHDPYILSA